MVVAEFLRRCSGYISGVSVILYPVFDKKKVEIKLVLQWVLANPLSVDNLTCFFTLRQYSIHGTWSSNWMPGGARWPHDYSTLAFDRWHSVVSLGSTLLSKYLSTQVYIKWVPVNVMLGVILRWTSSHFQGGAEILLVALCHRNRDKLQLDGPLGSYADLAFLY